LGGLRFDRRRLLDFHADEAANLTAIQTLTSSPEERLSADALDPVTASVIKPVVRRTLHVSLRDADTSAENQDALELVGDIQVALLSALESSGNGRPIENIDAYAATVATNACYQHLRAKFPVRAQQINKLRYLLTHDPRFAMFKSDEVWYCKLAGESAHTRRSENHEREKYAQAVVSLLRERDPLPLDDLVSELMTALGVFERKSLDVDEPFDHVAGNETPADRNIELRDRLRGLWKGVLELSLKHRKALLLNLRDRDGGLIWALPISGVANLADIAAALGMRPDELAEMWPTLPWDDLRIADHLGLQRQQVINLRQSARAKLARQETG
jgi:DNA-directed RNA polymerase specialized sigma24 family protein